MSENNRIITVGHLSNYIYCERAWLLNVAGVRDDPEIAALIHKVSPKPASFAPTAFIEDLSRSPVSQPGMGTSPTPSRTTKKSSGCPLAVIMMFSGFGVIALAVYSIVKL